MCGYDSLLIPCERTGWTFDSSYNHVRFSLKAKLPNYRETNLSRVYSVKLGNKLPLKYLNIRMDPLNYGFYSAEIYN